MKDAIRINKIQSILSATYPKATIALAYTSPWELLVAVMLSAQCTDKIVNTVTPSLFAAYPTMDAFAGAKQSDMERLIHATGFYRNKAKHIIAAARYIKKQFLGEVPHTMKDMITIPGVARKTANVVLGNAYGVVEGIAVDTHVIRLSQRLRLVPLNSIGGNHSVFVQKNKTGDVREGMYFAAQPRLKKAIMEAEVVIGLAGAHKIHTDLSTSPNKQLIKCVDFIKDASPEKIEAELMKIIPKNHWLTITYELIDHGRALCKAQRPLCNQCPLQPYCPVAR